MIRMDARPNALTRVNIDVAQHQLPEMSPLRRHFVTIMNNGDNTITINSNKGINFPRICKIPFRTHNGEVITTDSFPDRETGEEVKTIVVFNTKTQEREVFRSSKRENGTEGAFFWVYSQEESFDIGHLSEVGFRQADSHMKKMYANVKNPTQYWIQIANYPDDNRTMIVNSNSDGRYPIAVRSIETNYGQMIKRKGEHIEIDGELHKSPVFRWTYLDLNEPNWAPDCVQSETETSQFTKHIEKMDDFTEWHIKNEFITLEDDDEPQQERAYDHYLFGYVPTPSGDVLQEFEDTSIMQFPEEVEKSTEGYISRTTDVSVADAATIRKHINNLVGTDRQMVDMMIDGLKGKVVFPDKTPVIETVNERGDPITKYIQGRELIRFNCRWIYYLSQELFNMENEVSEDIKLTNQEEYQQAMRDITEILSFSQDEDEYQNMIDGILENNLEHHHKVVDGIEVMTFPKEVPAKKKIREIEEETEDPAVRSHYYSKVDENNWNTETKRNGELHTRWNPETYQRETFIGYETLPEHKYNLMENREQ